MWEDVRKCEKMRRCEKMWEDVRRCEKMWEDLRRWGNVSRCKQMWMWRWEDVKRWEDVRRCEDEKMWENVKMWEDVKMRRCDDGMWWQTSTIRRTLRSDALGKMRSKCWPRFCSLLLGPVVAYPLSIDRTLVAACHPIPLPFVSPLLNWNDIAQVKIMAGE